jgi:hypothetical protein
LYAYPARCKVIGDPVYLNAKQLDCSSVLNWQVPEFACAKHEFEAILSQFPRLQSLLNLTILGKVSLHEP